MQEQRANMVISPNADLPAVLPQYRFRTIKQGDNVNLRVMAKNGSLQMY